MVQATSNEEPIIDYITGAAKPNIGAEDNRQKVERHLVDVLGYAKSQIEVDAPITVEIDQELYSSTVDLVVYTRGKRIMAIKCAPGSLDSREREVIAAARLLEAYQLPLAVASDGLTAFVWDAVSGQKIGQGLDAIPSKALAEELCDHYTWPALEPSRASREKLIFRSYDSMNINVASRNTRPR